MKKNKKALFERCPAIRNGVQCEQDINNHIQNFGYLKHNAKVQGFWTDKGDVRDKTEVLQNRY